MEIVFLQALGALAFLIGTLFVGVVIRHSPSKTSAERLSRISHALFWCGLVLPEFVGIFYPGLSAFDGLLGLPSLPFTGAAQTTGWLVLGVGVYCLAMSAIALKDIGFGYPAFKLTRDVVANSVYNRVRNPMSLGTYLSYIGISLIAGSTSLLFGAVLVIIPLHAFNLLYFEEHELLARFGRPYEEYKKRVPFILPFKGR